jgi:hypothetical protein
MCRARMINFQKTSNKCPNLTPKGLAMKLSASLILVRYRKRIQCASQPKVYKLLTAPYLTPKAHNQTNLKALFKV